jgi:hypothetical protein
MPVCKNCGDRFPCRMTIDGKRRNLGKRKYCLICSPFGAHNTIPIHKLKPLDSGDSVCVVCGRRYLYDRKKGHTRNKCNSCSVNERRYKLKQKCVDYKGGKCEHCGYTGNIKVFNFHHIDPTEKEFGISGAHCRSWKSLEKELNKCIMLCANCHIVEHDKMLEI